MVDGFCGHSYWKKPDDLSNRHEGLSWLDVKEAFPNKPIYVTEFANKDKDAPFSEKGRQYRTYRNLLRQNGAAAGFVFVLHWTAEQDHDNESWVDEAGGSKGVAESFLA
jgi:hypothetical protein